MSTALAGAAAVAVGRAEAEWKAWPALGKMGQPTIRDGYITASGGTLGRTSRANWCGWFAAFCWLSVHPTLRKHLVASTYRLFLFGSYGADKNLWPPDAIQGTGPRGEKTTKRYHISTGKQRKWTKGVGCGAVDILPGDILCVRSGKDEDPNGGHVVLAVEPCGLGQTHVATISGNGQGARADSSVGGGVVRNDYSREDIRQIIRLSAHDLNPELTYLGG